MKQPLVPFILGVERSNLKLAYQVYVYTYIDIYKAGILLDRS